MKNEPGHLGPLPEDHKYMYDLIKNNPPINADEIKDKCIICKEDSLYTKNTHIDNRAHYIEGVGQLCRSCYNKIYKIKNDTEHLSGY